MSGDRNRDTGGSGVGDGARTLSRKQTSLRERGAGQSEEDEEHQVRVPGVRLASRPSASKEWQRELLELGRSLRQAGEYLVAMAGALASGDAQAQGGRVDREGVVGSGAPQGGHGGAQRQRLTPCECESLALFGRGLSYAEIAQERGVQSCTVSEQLKSARAKMEATTTREAVARARELGLIE